MAIVYQIKVLCLGMCFAFYNIAAPGPLVLLLLENFGLNKHDNQISITHLVIFLKSIL